MCVCSSFFFFFNQAAKHRVPMGSQRSTEHNAERMVSAHEERWVKLRPCLNFLKILSSVPYFSSLSFNK